MLDVAAGHEDQIAVGEERARVRDLGRLARELGHLEARAGADEGGGEHLLEADVVVRGDADVGDERLLLADGSDGALEVAARGEDGRRGRRR